MRIITGSVRGLPLVTPSQDIRPTMDRVRAAIFSSLGDAVPGARVLDLFAGSGALGLEALSRGALSAVFVDSSHQSTQCIRRNLSRAGLAGSIQTMDAFRFLELYGGEDLFDLIFADPPYAKSQEDRDFGAELIASSVLRSALSPTGTLVLESLKSNRPGPTNALRLLSTKCYGKTAVSMFVQS